MLLFPSFSLSHLLYMCDHRPFVHSSGALSPGLRICDSDPFASNNAKDLIHTTSRMITIAVDKWKDTCHYGLIHKYVFKICRVLVEVSAILYRATLALFTVRTTLSKNARLDANLPRYLSK